ncbi:hypothetical protein ACFL5V_13465 [Fibrobacterota bacterium]
MFFDRMDAGWHPELISTHPSPENRVEAVTEQVDGEKADGNWVNLDDEEHKYSQRYLGHIAAIQ